MERDYMNTVALRSIGIPGYELNHPLVSGTSSPSLSKKCEFFVLRNATVSSGRGYGSVQYIGHCIISCPVPGSNPHKPVDILINNQELKPKSG